jgi:hypothetical protein
MKRPLGSGLFVLYPTGGLAPYKSDNFSIDIKSKKSFHNGVSARNN